MVFLRFTDVVEFVLIRKILLDTNSILMALKAAYATVLSYGAALLLSDYTLSSKLQKQIDAR
ncbi:hypothetical protein J26TS2_37390 [Shouchella clausii]|nr:hypothetical protein J26TS2_37390 [Shouchella clausii]